MTEFSPVWAIITSGVSWIRSALWKEYSDRKNASIYQAGRRFIDRFTETDADALDAAKSTYYNQNQLSFFTDWILIFHFRRHTVAHFSFKFGGQLFMCSFLLKSTNLCKTIPDISLLELLLNQSLRSISLTHYLPPGGVLMGIPGVGLQPGSPNPDPISDKKMLFFTPVYRPDL